MEDKKPNEPAIKIKPGDKVIRRTIEHRKRLRVAPNVPEVIRFLKFIFTQTPLLRMVVVWLVLWLIFSAAFYFAERNANPEHVHSYGQALWWGMAAVETMGTPYKPVTTAGEVIGGIWAMLGVFLLWGAVVASVTTYFMRRREGTVKQIVTTVEYNLEQLDKLSVDELKVLKETTDGLINEHIKRREEQEGKDKDVI